MKKEKKKLKNEKWKILPNLKSKIEKMINYNIEM